MPSSFTLIDLSSVDDGEEETDGDLNHNHQTKKTEISTNSLYHHKIQQDQKIHRNDYHDVITTSHHLIEHLSSKYSSSHICTFISNISNHSSPMIHIQQKDNWSCGYRNLQMIMSTKLITIPSCSIPTNQQHEQKSNKKQDQHQFINDTYRQLPSIDFIQHEIHSSWSKGYDEIGRNDYNNKIINTKNKIGAMEVLSLCTYWDIDCVVIQFIKCPESRHLLPIFVWYYFKYLRDIIWIDHYHNTNTAIKQSQLLNEPQLSQDDPRHPYQEVIKSKKRKRNSNNDEYFTQEYHDDIIIDLCKSNKYDESESARIEKPVFDENKTNRHQRKDKIKNDENEKLDLLKLSSDYYANILLEHITKDVKTKKCNSSGYCYDFDENHHKINADEVNSDIIPNNNNNSEKDNYIQNEMIDGGDIFQPIPPLYLQWKGHSVTIIGVEKKKRTTSCMIYPHQQQEQEEYAYNLLVFDPLKKVPISTKTTLKNDKNKNHAISSIKNVFDNVNDIQQPFRLSCNELKDRDCQILLFSKRKLSISEKEERKLKPNVITAAASSVISFIKNNE